MQVLKCSLNSYNFNNINKTPKFGGKENAVFNKTADYQTNVFVPSYSYNINFRALNWGEIHKYTNDLSKRIYSKRHINEFYEIYKDANGITAGNGLPEVWTSRIKDISHFDKDSFIENFGKIFAEERIFADVDKVQKRLTQLFRQHKILDDNESLDVQYIGHGFQAWAYKISTGDENDKGIVTKLFKRHDNIFQNHGNKTEQNLAEYIRAYTNNDSEFVKYYYGDTKNGIMLVDYIPEDIEPPKTKLDMSDIGIGYGDDYPRNRINGYICDYGGIETVSNLIGNKPAQEVHRAIKYASSDEEKVRIFNELYSQRVNTDEFKDKAIGLVHAIKFMPKEMQAELYKKCYDLKSHRVNIALIQNIKNFAYLDETAEMIEDLVLNSVDQKEMETSAKEIKYIPSKVRHLFFEQQIDSKVSAVIKYLARNINMYYHDLPNRNNIYNRFIENCDIYSGMALIGSMKHMSSSHFDEYFEKFYAKNDSAINTALARSLEVLNDDIILQGKWIKKLLECNDRDVNTGLAESVSYVRSENRSILFEKLLSSQDKVTKEFLAQNLSAVPGYTFHTEWVEKILDGADNMVRGALLNTVKSMPESMVKTNWINMIMKGSDKTIKVMSKNAN